MLVIHVAERVLTTNVRQTIICVWVLFFDIGSIPVLQSRLGSPPNRSIILDNVICTGREDNLSECDHNDVGVNNCDRSEEAGVECEGIKMN